MRLRAFIAGVPLRVDARSSSITLGRRLESCSAKSASPLTAREHEIVILIARGLSNRQIADELVISPATAARHVANILAKLGFTSRTQVASWAARHEPPR